MGRFAASSSGSHGGRYRPLAVLSIAVGILSPALSWAQADLGTLPRFVLRDSLGVRGVRPKATPDVRPPLWLRGPRGSTPGPVSDAPLPAWLRGPRFLAGSRPLPDAFADACDPAGSATWVPIPGPFRYGHTMIYDPVRDRLVVCGGQSLYASWNDIWTLPLAEPDKWSELLPSGAPPVGREYHSAIYDPIRDRMIVFGGYSPFVADRGVCLNDVWAFSFTALAWTHLFPSGAPP